MNKYIELRKKTLKTAVMAAIAIAVVAAIYGGLSMMVDSVTEQRTSAEGKLNADNGLLSSLRNQMDKSGEAEKRYSAIQENKASTAFETDIKVLKEFLVNASLRYKLDPPRIKAATPIISDKPELANFNYNVQAGNRFKISFKAVSDVHVFSFLNEFRNALPGFIRIDAIEIRRLSDLTEPALVAIGTSGTMPLNVEVKVEFTWIGLVSKDKNKPSSASGNPVSTSTTP